MTFDDDFLIFNFDHGVVRQPCRAVNVKWPPPEQLSAFGFQFKRLRLSEITDEQRASMTHVCRGAEYEIEP